MSRANLILLALIACIAALPLFGGAYTLRLGTIACMYAIMALSWNVVGGFAGYPSFATAAFFGLGATVVDDLRSPDGRGWAVLADPEGNELCILRSEAERAA